MKLLSVALTGNPNSGKSSIFNNLTGSNQHVANYPGVTVETREGNRRRNETQFKIIDLPGAYSLTDNSPEEYLARKCILEQKPDVVVQIVDASSLERSLYLTLQLLDLGVKLVLDLNMIDEVQAHGFKIDLELLSQHLGIEVVTTVGHRNIGSDDLLEAIERTADKTESTAYQCRYGDLLGPFIDELSQWTTAKLPITPQSSTFPAHWAAVKFFEGDREVHEWLKKLDKVAGHEFLEDLLSRATQACAQVADSSVASIIADIRYGVITGIVKEVVSRVAIPSGLRYEISDKIDRVMLNRYVAFPIFIILMYLMFQFVFTLAEPFMGWIEDGFGMLSEFIGERMSEGPLKSLVLDGAIGGVGGIIVFLPNILFLFFFIGLLEKSGYMARAAFIMDRLMHKVGLHGRSFIPMLTGFGCSIPGIMATRTLEHEKDRLATMMILPLMSCGARMPIYALLIPAFFPTKWSGLVFFSMYAIGVVLAIVLVKLLRSTILSGESTPFIMELPPYRMPTLRSILLDMWEKAWSYLRRAGTLIFAISIILWAATSYPKKAEFEIDSTPQAETMAEEELEVARAAEDLSYSVSGRIGHILEPIARPLGFDWSIVTAFVGALAAKEVFVAQMGIVYSIADPEAEEVGLQKILQRKYNSLQGFCIMLFALISSPCVATFAVMKRESNSWKWALLQFFGLTVLAWIVTFIVYQSGLLLKLGV